MTPAAIEVLDLRYTYADGKEALKGISFAIAEGECVGLIGPNGSGKSTLLLHLNGVLPQVFGREAQVVVAGMPLAAKTLLQVRKMVGLLFQDPDDQLFCPTVFEDVAFGPQQFGFPDSRNQSYRRRVIGKSRAARFRGTITAAFERRGETAGVSGRRVGLPARSFGS